MNVRGQVWRILLAIYLILVGIVALSSLAISPLVFGVLALAAGIFTLVGA